ncbi:MAG: HAD family hydrolase [Fimbriimonadaceae bacterium]|nr:HAD family hydrolase [Fimbriimonadaceae bacterium]
MANESGVTPQGRRRFVILRRGCPGIAGRAKPRGPQKPAIFFDRDGVLNVDHGYVAKMRDWEWTPEAIRAIRYMKRKGYRVIVVTNQSGIGRELYTEEELLVLSEFMLREAPIDAIYYCPHHPDERCPARKPGTSMLEAAKADWDLDLTRSFLIGDRDTDIQAAERFGIPGFSYRDGSLYQFCKDAVRRAST